MWDVKKGIWDNIMTKFYSYLYFVLFLLGIFILIYFMCFGKKTNKKTKWSWGEIGNAFSSFKKTTIPNQKIPKKNEHRCRQIMEYLFKVPFPSVRPDFLKYPPTGKNLEFDGYNEQLNVAFEYDGIQHRVWLPRYHKTEEEFFQQQKRDDWKDKRCEELGIRLLRIPDTVSYNDLGKYITSEVKKWYQEE